MKNTWYTGTNNEIYISILCLTTEDREISISFCERKFLDWISFNPKLECVEDYMVEFLNQTEYNNANIEGEFYVQLLEPMKKELKDEATLRIDTTKYNL